MKALLTALFLGGLAGALLVTMLQSTGSLGPMPERALRAALVSPLNPTH